MMCFVLMQICTASAKMSASSVRLWSPIASASSYRLHVAVCMRIVVTTLAFANSLKTPQLRSAAEALKGGNRDKYIIATKFAFFLNEEGGLGLRGTPEYVK